MTILEIHPSCIAGQRVRSISVFGRSSESCFYNGYSTSKRLCRLLTKFHPSRTFSILNFSHFVSLLQWKSFINCPLLIPVFSSDWWTSCVGVGFHDDLSYNKIVDSFFVNRLFVLVGYLQVINDFILYKSYFIVVMTRERDRSDSLHCSDLKWRSARSQIGSIEQGIEN